MLAARDAADPVCFGEKRGSVRIEAAIRPPKLYGWLMKIGGAAQSFTEILKHAGICPGGAVLERWAFRYIPSPVCSHAPCCFKPGVEVPSSAIPPPFCRCAFETAI